MRITKPRYCFLFVQPNKKFLEESTKVEETYFLTFFGNKYMIKNLTVETCIKTQCDTQFLNCSSIQVICITLRQAERAKLKIMQKII